MKTPRAAFAAAAIPLLLTSLPVTAAELPFNAPNTARAQESAQLLHQAARALGASHEHVSNLWIFPTGDPDTVFAQYEVSSNEVSSNEVSSNEEGALPARRLTVLKVRDSRVVEQKELTDPRTYAVAAEERSSATPDWTASIGTGHASSTDVTKASHGVPATPHWTAQIGTGAAASSVTATEAQQPSSSRVADVHWTSRIGTGHAVQANGQAGT